MKKIKFSKILVLIEIVILLLLGILLGIRWKEDKPIKVSMTDWESDYAKWDDTQGWYINDKLVKTDEKIVFLSGPFIFLEKGTYSATIEYECDEDQSCIANKANISNLCAGSAILGKKQNTVSYDFELTTDVDFELQINYSGKGYLRIKDISIVKTPIGFLRTTVIIFALFVCLDLVVFFWERIKQNRNILMALLGIVLLTSLPLFSNGMNRGHDSSFHLMRIESIAEEIRLGNIPVRMSSLYMDGAGYPVSVYYGDLLLYVPAVLRLLGFSVMTAYKFYVLMINMGTVLITYFCMKGIFKEKRIALLTCLTYCTASYRLVNIYVRSAVGEYSAMMFLPIVALAVYRIYTDDVQNFKEYKKNALFLAIGMSGLIGTHMLSTEMVIFVLAVICVFLFKMTIRQNTIKVYFGAVIETCLLSAYFIVPFLDYYVNVPVSINASIQNGYRLIQAKGACFSEYFTFFKNIYGGGSSVCTNDRMLLTPGMILMSVLVLAVVLWVNGRSGREMKVLTVCSGVILFAASNMFPWNELAIHFRVGGMLSQVQFPWRYIGLSIITLTLLLGNILQRTDVNKILGQYGIEKFIVFACIFMTCFFVGSYNDSEGSNLGAYYGRAELSTYSIGNGEYLRQMEGWKDMSVEVSSNHMEQVSIDTRKGTYMKLYCKGTDKEGEICLPIWNYKGYHVTDEDGNEYEITDSDNKQIRFFLPAGFDGYVTVDFAEPWYWRAAELISLLSVIYLCIRQKMTGHR